MCERPYKPQLTGIEPVMGEPTRPSRLASSSSRRPSWPRCAHSVARHARSQRPHPLRQAVVGHATV